MGSSFTCQKCFSVKDILSWHCRICLFDVCEQCGGLFGYKPYVDKILCERGHSLIEDYFKPQDSGPCQDAEASLRYFECNSCPSKEFEGKRLPIKIYDDGVFNSCYTCDYKNCSDCIFFNLPLAGHPVLRCHNLHLLRWTNSSVFYCDYCFKIEKNERYSCRKCSFNVCLQCSDLLFNFAIDCNRNNYDLFTWTSGPFLRNKGKPVKCKKCKNLFSKGGIFVRYIVQECYKCILCYFNIIRENQQLSQE